MQLGMIGLGRMGANIVRRLMRNGHECVVFDVNRDFVSRWKPKAPRARHHRGVRRQAQQPRAAG